MNNNKWVYLVYIAALSMVTVSCKKDLNVGNPNQPNIQANVTNEAGIISLASGGVYINGFYNGDGWLGNSFFSLPFGYAELLGDVVGNEGASNQLISQVNVPNYLILDDLSKVDNSGSYNRTALRLNNTRAQTGSGYNPVYYQWLNMYALNGAMNQVISLASNIKFS